MAGLFDKQSELYATARPDYPPEWFAKLAMLTTHHKLVWDVGTGNGQAAVCAAEHYDMVIATDVSEAQIRCATVHPKVRYVQTSVSTAADELVRLLGGEGMVDLVIVAQAVHWFDLPFFYSVATRVLRKPGGVIAVWGYNDVEVSPVFDSVFKLFHATTLPYWDPRILFLFDAYRSLPFPFESVGVGSEGNPEMLDLEKEKF
ncbi:hypothetical protein HPP92_009651 [Vanilla planifolia]|uniref:Methyltransferase type 11 domain-containing protein n=1 Tax=Vanilla planifolia TaxID=51239 RepID=A0A835V921_VANPL|nr:hypothetical protein HPP92_009651 [Vanilla planifolia]